MTGDGLPIQRWCFKLGTDLPESKSAESHSLTEWQTVAVTLCLFSVAVCQTMSLRVIQVEVSTAFSFNVLKESRP